MILVSLFVVISKRLEDLIKEMGWSLGNPLCVDSVTCPKRFFLTEAPFSFWRCWFHCCTHELLHHLHGFAYEPRLLINLADYVMEGHPRRLIKYLKIV